MTTETVRINVVVGHGYGVSIRRRDGTELLCSNESGLLPPIWRARKNAVEHKRKLVVQGFKARVVKVSYQVVHNAAHEPTADNQNGDQEHERRN